MKKFDFPQQTHFYQGKVRDVYTINNNWLLMIASDRISAFDVILPRTIPFKGQALNQVAAYMLRATQDICQNWLVSTPAANVSLGKKCLPFKIEMVVRGNLTGHAWRTYQQSKRILCGAEMPDNMKENDFFPSPIITPSTKAAAGHDEDISKEEIIQQGLASKDEWEKLSKTALALFERGKQIASSHGLILADTKYEFGKIGEELYLMDEIHTPDSSRYFYAKDFEEKQTKGERQKQLSKEFVREWLIENNFMGQAGQQVPNMSDDWVDAISKRYIELYEILIGEKFNPAPLTDEILYENILLELKTRGII
ncbi:MAG: phosphoribosylaminoimidazolesuccinocarboxamide synthase [Chitinophagaceae bacterium]